MDSNIVKFPYSASRRVEERSAKAAADAVKMVPADVVDLSGARAGARSPQDGPPAERIDRRKLRGNPLREQCALISFAVTVVGKMHTAELREETLSEFSPAEIASWLQDLRAGEEAMRIVAIGLERATEQLMQAQAKETPIEQRIKEKYLIREMVEERSAE